MNPTQSEGKSVGLYLSTKIELLAYCQIYTTAYPSQSNLSATIAMNTLRSWELSIVF